MSRRQSRNDLKEPVRRSGSHGRIANSIKSGLDKLTRATPRTSREFGAALREAVVSNQPYPTSLNDTSGQHPVLAHDATALDVNEKATMPPTAMKGSQDTRKAAKQNSQEGWMKVSRLLQDYDDRRIRRIKDDIDTLLVFAGLFSAVLTAFVIESYQLLQDDFTETTARILLQVSLQLNSLTINNGFINSTAPVAAITTFIPESSSVRVNIFWFLSLFLSLTTASLGIFVKQWWRSYSEHNDEDPQSYIRLRFFRSQGMEKWRVEQIGSILPSILQFALILFFVGLIDFLNTLNPIVGWTIAGFILCWFFLVLLITVAPAFSSICPYRILLLKGTWTKVRWGVYTAYNCMSYGFTKLTSSLTRNLSPTNKSDTRHTALRLFVSPRRWLKQQLECQVAKPVMEWYICRVPHHNPQEESDIHNDQTHDHGLLAACDMVVSNDVVLKAVGQCLADLPLSSALSCIKNLIVHRSNSADPKAIGRPFADAALYSSDPLFKDFENPTCCEQPLRVWRLPGEVSNIAPSYFVSMVHLMHEEVETAWTMTSTNPAMEEPIRWRDGMDQGLTFLLSNVTTGSEQAIGILVGRLFALGTTAAERTLEVLVRTVRWDGLGVYPQLPKLSYTDSNSLKNMLMAACAVVDSADTDVILPPDFVIAHLHSGRLVELYAIVLVFISQSPVAHIRKYDKFFVELQQRLGETMQLYGEVAFARLWDRKRSWYAKARYNGAIPTCYLHET
ncbi:unnamed protein product [Somion occarium]|uniref:DUF6535 domain-containing protein n=1 Tax=Somion occarium TaxID=3059160 RepID=A0ABP1E0N4_9APHY